MSDDDSPIKEKIFSTPESKQKVSSKFNNLLDDLELRTQKLLLKNKNKENSTNTKLDTTSTNSDNNKKDIMVNDSKNKNQNNINKTNNNTSNKNVVKKFNSFEEGQLKKAGKKNNEKKNNNNIKNESLLSRMSKEITKLTHERNSISGINHINININININNKNNTNGNKSKKLRPSTPSIRNFEEPNSTNNINTTNKSKKKEKKEQKESNKIDPLYIPHIVTDPLDILKQKIEKIINISDNDINTITNKISLVDIEMENLCSLAHENYSKEKKIRATYNKYDFALYKMFKTYGENNNKIYDEMMKDKVDQIIEIEQEFNNKKNKLKIELNEKIEDIKKNIEKKRKKEDSNNINMLNDVKKNIFNILYDKDKSSNNNKNIGDKNNSINNIKNNSDDKKNNN